MFYSYFSFSVTKLQNFYCKKEYEERNEKVQGVVCEVSGCFEKKNGRLLDCNRNARSVGLLRAFVSDLISNSLKMA
jgi:DNA-binding transcriptional regulator LsrR (DeoR family)